MEAERRVMRVVHNIKDNKHHVEVFIPSWPVPFREGYFEVEDTFKTPNALWSGYFEALDWSKEYEADLIDVHSSDAEGFAEWSRQFDEDYVPAE